MNESTEITVPNTDNVTELTDFIEDMFGKLEKMDGRKKKEIEEHKLLINTAIDKVNTLRGFKMYKKC